ncbi:hypothetical protein N7533_001894 [Penicillium manginii]|uniref:uncharacterized protein n=1 Tax=Penicillium manginii TaxID=203109 RepID=UPI00254954EB|nr:uncharacterized protein N7533_001894 [Penicillium manginii]KAJ5763213.1 hypothetical protein N7533_001894 [Penicillium manginii]
MSNDLWVSLISTIDPSPDAMSAVLQSTIHLLESELVKARAALQEIQPHAPLFRIGDDVSVGAMEAYRQNLIGRAPDFYGARRLTPKELGFEPMVRELTPMEIIPTPAPIAQPAPAPPRQAPLEEMLTNSLILDHMAPYLSVPSMMALASSSRLLHNMITHTPYLFRHLDLTRCKGAQLRDATKHENDTQTEDEFYSRPLRRIFTSLERRSLLQDVRTLVLDGLSVPADLVAEIILNDRFNVNILSIRECRNLNERKLMQTIQYAVRPTRPEGTPRVKGIYHFSPRHTAPRPVVRRRRYRDWWSDRVGNSQSPSESSSNNSSEAEEEDSPILKHQQNEWYAPTGRLFKHSIEEGWATTIQKCEGIIAFDAVLCRGSRHNPNNYTTENEAQNTPPTPTPPAPALAPAPAPEAPMLGPAVATVALGPRGCNGCHSSPEGPAIWGQSPDTHFPLLGPVPMHQSSIPFAKSPELRIPGKHPVLIARCADCLTDRWCHRCNKWFCENCLENPQHVRANLSPHQTAVRQPGSSSTHVCINSTSRLSEIAVH